MALILSMLQVSFCCVSDSRGNCDGRRECASDSGRSRKWPPFVLQGWGRERAASAPPPQLGECLRMWRAYLLTGGCKIAGLRTASSLRGEGRIWSPPETSVHAQTIEDLQDPLPGWIKSLVASPFLSGTKHPIYSLTQSGEESPSVSILPNSFGGAFVSWDFPGGLWTNPSTLSVTKKFCSNEKKLRLSESLPPRVDQVFYTKSIHLIKP